MRYLTDEQLAEAVQLALEFTDAYADRYTELCELAEAEGQRIGWLGTADHFDAREDGRQWWTATDDTGWVGGRWANSPAEAAIMITAGHGMTPTKILDDPHSEVFMTLTRGRALRDRAGYADVQLALF